MKEKKPKKVDRPRRKTLYKQERENKKASYHRVIQSPSSRTWWCREANPSYLVEKNCKKKKKKKMENVILGKSRMVKKSRAHRRVIIIDKEERKASNLRKPQNLPISLSISKRRMKTYDV